MRQSIYRKLGVFAIAVSLLTGLFQKADAQQANTGNYDLSLSVKSATVKTFTEAFTQKTGVLFSYEAGLAQKPMGDINIDVKGASLTSILDDVFGKQMTGFKYKLMSSTVVITADRQMVSKTGNITVSGKVTDRSGEPLIGAGVLVKGTSKGVTTDLNGNYTLETAPDAVLVYSFIGYKDQEEKVLNRSQINVSISEDANILDDVVVVGYGTQSRKSLTTSISKVDGNKLYAAPVSNIGDALKGKVTGLRVATNNTISGNAPRFLIRGGSSISLSNDPVVIVDGVTRDMDDLNPNDIESIEVLKDAASAGIYGARASNGVILVTTKKGNSWERPRITFDAQVGWSSPSRKWDLMNAREFLSFVRPAIAQGPNGSVILNGANAAGTGNKDTDIFTTKYLDKNELVKDGWQWMYDPLDPTKVLTFTDTDWQSQWFSNALWHKEYIGVNGGSKNVKYAASVSYLQDDGMVAMSGYKLFTMHGNTSFNITKGLVASTTFDFSRSIKNPLTGNYFNAIGRGLMMSPTNREFYDDGRWATGGTNKNQQSASFYEAFYDREMAQNRFGGNFKLEWTIIDGLKATAQYAIFDDNYRGSYYEKGQVGETPNYISTRSTTETRTQTTKDSFTAYLNYKKTFGGKHKIDATAGYDYMKWRYWYVNAKSTGSVSDKVPIIDSGTNFTASNKDEKQALISYFGRVNYNYDDRYIVSATLRADGSSKFAEGNRWGYFPAASAAWVISEEPFWNAEKSKMNTFKFRASYGQTGNNGIGLYDTYGAFATSMYAGQSTLLPSAMQNSGMKWETTTQLDLGFDLGFFNDRLRIVMDYYNKTTDNMLFSITLPDTGSLGSVKANVGSARFYGAEIEISSVNIRKKNFEWSTDFTYSFNKNKVLSLPDEWNYTTRGLAAICREGVDSIGAALKELENHGYIRRTQLRDEKGKITDTEYVIYEMPQCEPPSSPGTPLPGTAKPYTENPDMGIPDTAEPCTENPAQLNTNQTKTDLSSTELSNPIQSNPPTPAGARMGTDGMGARECYREVILDNIEYSYLVQDSHIDREQLDEIVDLIVDTVCSARKVIRIAGDDYPAEVVKSRFMKLDSSHVQYVMDCMKDNTTYVRNIKKYLLAALYNAPTTINSYYSSLVQHDMYGDGQRGRG